MNKEFEQFKREVVVDLDLGRPLDQAETVVLKGFYYFAKGLRLVKVMKSKKKSRD